MGGGVMEKPFKCVRLMLSEGVRTHVGRGSKNELFLHAPYMDDA